ncbi:MAG: ABC transporter ATP-binding protein [Acholeplasmataceae bacterium]|jgi:multiple sugar transport system ATP-binding protein
MEIRLENLTKIFIDKQKNETRAIDNLNVVIESGKLVGLLGPSGCGKSTTLFAIAGLHDPTEGRIYFGEDDVTKLSPDKRGIGLVFQNYALYPHMTVKQNIMFPLENLMVPREEALERTQDIANLVGIGALLERKPAQLSGGQQQRVAIARALVKMPRVLLLDEPLSNLDARLRLHMREEIKRIQRETGITTIFVTHDQEEAMSISDQIIIMETGKEMQRGRPQDIYNHPNNIFVAKFLGNPPINIFRGRIKNNYLYYGDQKILPKVAPDGEYDVGIRPEDFKVSPTPKDAINIQALDVSVIGRDTMIRFVYGDSEVRALVESESLENITEINLTVKDEKIHLFDIETGLALAYIPQLSEEEIKMYGDHHQMMLARDAEPKADEVEAQLVNKRKKNKKSNK